MKRGRRRMEDGNAVDGWKWKGWKGRGEERWKEGAAGAPASAAVDELGGEAAGHF